ncbi:MAG: hypothetical protein R2741_04560 [Methanolobus sp.]
MEGKEDIVGLEEDDVGIHSLKWLRKTLNRKDEGTQGKARNA